MLPEGGGGDTLFADMEVAYASLEPDVGFRLCGLSARYGSEHVYRGRYADRGAVEDGVTYTYRTFKLMYETMGGPGKTQSFILKFDEAGEVVDACALDPMPDFVYRRQHR